MGRSPIIPIPGPLRKTACEGCKVQLARNAVAVCETCDGVHCAKCAHSHACPLPKHAQPNPIEALQTGLAMLSDLDPKVDFYFSDGGICVGDYLTLRARMTPAARTLFREFGWRPHEDAWCFRR